MVHFKRIFIVHINSSIYYCRGNDAGIIGAAYLAKVALDTAHQSENKQGNSRSKLVLYYTVGPMILSMLALTLTIYPFVLRRYRNR